ncbi:MAG: hypothetical protein AAFV92_06690, partial [Pseudomonadota bacterium]
MIHLHPGKLSALVADVVPKAGPGDGVIEPRREGGRHVPGAARPNDPGHSVDHPGLVGDHPILAIDRPDPSTFDQLVVPAFLE